MASSDFRAYEKVMSQAEQNARAQHKASKEVLSVEKEAKHIAEALVSEQKRAEAIEKRLQLLTSIEAVEGKLSESQKKQLALDNAELDNIKAQTDELKKNKSLQAF